MAGEHRVLGVQHHEVGGRPGRQPVTGPTGRVGAAREHPPEQLPSHVRILDGSHVPGLRGESLPVFEPAQFLEGVDGHLAVGADRDPAAGAQEALQGEQAVAEVPLGTGAKTDDRVRGREIPDLRVVEVGGVDQAPLLTHVEPVQQPANRAGATDGEAVLDFPALLRDVDVQRRPAGGRARGHLVQGGLADRAQAVGADPDRHPPGSRTGRAFLVSEEALDIHREPPLPRFRSGGVETRTLVEHREVDQADAAVPGRPAERFEHGVPVPGVVAEEIVELHDRGVAGSEHLRVRLPGNGGQAPGIEPPGEFVHVLAPGPERIAPGPRAMFGPSGQRPLERMAVGVGQARDHDPGGQSGGRRGGDSRGDLHDGAVADAEQHILRPSGVQERATRQDPLHRRFRKLGTGYRRAKT